MALARILVLYVMLFMVPSCPHVIAAVVLLVTGITVYSLLWLIEIICEKRKRRD